MKAAEFGCKIEIIDYQVFIYKVGIFMAINSGFI